MAAGLLAPGLVIGTVLYIILIAILLYTMFKLLLRLVNCFLTIIYYTVIAPFYFLFASLPGRQGMATGWILDMLGNILAFPAIIAVFYFVNYLLGKGAIGTASGLLPFPVGGTLNLTGKANLPLFGGLDTSFFRLVLAIGALMATPSIPDIIARAIGRVSQAGQMIGQEIGGGFSRGQGYAGQASQSFGKLSSLSDTPGYLFENGRWIKSYDKMSGARPGAASKGFGWLGDRINPTQPIAGKKP